MLTILEPAAMLDLEKPKLQSALEELKQVPGLYEFVREHCFLAGGAVRDVYRHVVPKDYDMFFKTEKALAAFKSDFAHKFTESVLGNYDLQTTSGKKFQFITMYVGEAAEVVGQFDWNVNQMYFAMNGKTHAWDTTDAYLTFNPKARTPLTAVARVTSMIEKGYKIKTEEFIFAMSFIAHLGLLTNEKKAENACTSLISSGGGVSGIGVGSVIARAKEASIPHTRLGKALTEND